MDIVSWGRNPWGQPILTHLSWNLLWVALGLGVAFLVAHALWVRYWPRPAAVPLDPAAQAALAALAARIPERVARHSLAARLFHWVMAAALFTLLFTSFLPIVGVKFAWVTVHWIAGLVFTGSVLFHIVHASVWLDFWSVWITRADVEDGWRRLRRSVGLAAPAPRKHPKYPLENKVYHGIILLTGVAAIGTGLVMLTRVRTPLLTRNPYLLSDQAWGLVYVLHGLVGVSLVALVMAHVYFAVRPEKLAITNSMVFGWMSRRFYLEHHDPTRWVVATPPAQEPEPQRRKIAV